MAGNLPKLIRMGIPDTLCKPGDYQYLIEYFGLHAAAIAEGIEKALA